MLPNRYTQSSSNTARKSRLESTGKSFLPKPRHAGSIDRLSSEPHRPSLYTSGVRSSSAEPQRITVNGARLSRDASATKIPLNRRSRSQQGESSRYVQGMMTPLRSSQYSNRPTTTPVRTPSEDRCTKNWKASLERALGFVTQKDQRPISNPAWQRAETTRVTEALAELGYSATLVRPLTIARFLDIVSGLLSGLLKECKLTNENYVTKLPNLAKLVLYPGMVSKSWLKTVNALHTYPQALALLSYLLDLRTRTEVPVTEDWLYVNNDEMAVLRRDFLYKCWSRFHKPDCQYDDLDQEYLTSLKQLLGNDEEKINELKQIIRKYESCLDDAVERAAREDEQRRKERRSELVAALRAAKAARIQTAADQRAALAMRASRSTDILAMEDDIHHANLENQQLSRELEEQTLSVEERSRLLDEVDYSTRVQDSKMAVCEQISKSLSSKESELALWQKKTLDSCVENRQALIHLSSKYQQLGKLAIDEKSLMEASGVEASVASLAQVRALANSLVERKSALLRDMDNARRHCLAQLEETKSTLTQLRARLISEEEALSASQAKESAEASEWAALEAEASRQHSALLERLQRYAAVDKDRAFWEEQEKASRSNLSALQKYVEITLEEYPKFLKEGKKLRGALVMNKIEQWRGCLEKSCKAEQKQLKAS